MKERAISPSMALRIGVMKIVAEPYVPEQGVTIFKTEKAKREELSNAMQKRINDLNDEIENLKGRKMMRQRE